MSLGGRSKDILEHAHPDRCSYTCHLLVCSYLTHSPAVRPPRQVTCCANPSHEWNYRLREPTACQVTGLGGQMHHAWLAAPGFALSPLQIQPIVIGYKALRGPEKVTSWGQTFNARIATFQPSWEQSHLRSKVVKSERVWLRVHLHLWDLRNSLLCITLRNIQFPTKIQGKNSPLWWLKTKRLHI